MPGDVSFNKQRSGGRRLQPWLTQRALQPKPIEPLPIQPPAIQPLQQLLLRPLLLQPQALQPRALRDLDYSSFSLLWPIIYSSKSTYTYPESTVFLYYITTRCVV